MGIVILLLASCTKDTSTKELINENAQLETRLANCMPSPGLGCTLFPRQVVVTHPLFVNCSFFIKYTVTKCYNPFKMTFSDFEIISHTCPAYATFITNCNASGNMEACMQVINSGFQNAMAQREFLQPDTPSGISNAVVYYYKASCNQYCFFDSYSEENQIVFLDNEKMPCTDGCCKRTVNYVKTQNLWQITSSTTVQISGNGCDNIIQAFPCPANSVITTGCLYECL